MAPKLDQSQWIRLGAAMALLVITGGILFCQNAGTRRSPARAWFLDMETGALIGSDSLMSPITLSSAAQAVLAHVYSCTSCDDDDSRQIAYVEKTIPVEPTASDEPRPIGTPTDSGVRVSDDRGKTWHSPQTPSGQTVIAKAEPRNACPDPQSYKICKP